MGHTTGPLVRLEGVRKCHSRGETEVVALAGLDLEVAESELVALLGPSGCGKSTTLNLIAGVDPADSGSISVCGIDLYDADESQLIELRRRDIGIVFQAFHLMPTLDVLDNVRLPLALAGRSDDERALELLDRVGLGHRLHHLPAELSGGERQRTAIARALVHRPRLVLADEPTGNLDSRGGKAVLELLLELQRAEGIALLVATHDQELADGLDRHVRLLDGHLVS